MYQLCLSNTGGEKSDVRLDIKLMRNYLFNIDKLTVKLYL